MPDGGEVSTPTTGSSKKTAVIKRGKKKETFRNYKRPRVANEGHTGKREERKEYLVLLSLTPEAAQKKIGCALLLEIKMTQLARKKS